MNILKRKEHLQVGIVVLVIIVCLLLIKSATIGINSIKATCKPLSEAGQNSPKVSDLEVLGELQQQIMEESASVAVEEAPPEPELAEDTSLVSVESYEPVLVAADEDEPEMVVEPDIEVIEETEVGATEETDAELFAQVEAAKTPEAFEWEAFEESQQQITEESTSVAADEVSSEPELFEELESVESSEPVLVAAGETEEIEEAEPEECPDASEPWIAEDVPVEATAESTFMVVAEPEPEPDMVEEPDLEVIAQAESEERLEEFEPWIAEDIPVEAAVESTYMVVAEPEPEETLVAYELEVVEESRQEIVKERESLVSCLQEVLGELKTIDVEGPMIESIEASEPEVVEAPQLEVSVMEEETELVSLHLANIIGKSVRAVMEEPQAAAEETEPDEVLEASESEVVEEPHQEIIGEQKSVFSYLQRVLKKLKR